MTTYFNQNTTYTASSYNELVTMVNYFVNLGKWSYVTSSATSVLFSINDEHSLTMPFYVKIDQSTDNSIIVTFGSSGNATTMTDIDNNASYPVVPYKFTLTDTITGGTLVRASEIIVNGYDSGLSIYLSKIKRIGATNYHGYSTLLNIERGYTLNGTKLEDIVAYGYTVGSSAATGNMYMSHTYVATSTQLIPGQFDCFNIISTITTKRSHEVSRPSFFVSDEAKPYGGLTPGWLPRVPLFNQDTLTLLMFGPFFYSTSLTKIYGNPYLLTCTNGYNPSYSASLQASDNYPYLLTKGIDVNLIMNGTGRDFYVPQTCFSRTGNIDTDGYYGHYYLFAKE